MQLVEEGKIDLKQDITDYMPDVKITNNTGTPVTVEHLLTHTTGFDFTDDYSLPQHIIQKGEMPLADFIRLNAPAVVRTPGEVYRYDNLASSMQGYIVERVSGEPFEDYVKSIFSPRYKWSTLHFGWMRISSQTLRLATMPNVIRLSRTKTYLPSRRKAACSPPVPIWPISSLPI